MIEPRHLDELARKLTAMMPASVQHLHADIERNLKAGLAGTFQRMELVTREEYEVQAALLARSREKIDALEARVKALEAKVLGSGKD